MKDALRKDKAITDNLNEFVALAFTTEDAGEPPMADSFFLEDKYEELVQIKMKVDKLSK